MLKETDYCLAFDEDFNPRIFGGSSLLFGRDALFLEAVIDAAAFGNPLFDDATAKRVATMAA